jgi:hypothetical protein
MTKAFRRWTAEEDALLALPDSAKVLAHILGRSIKAVLNRREDLRNRGLLPGRPANRPWREEDDRKLRHMYAAGQRDPAIAAAMSRSPASIRVRRHYLGLVRTAEAAIVTQPRDPETGMRLSKWHDLPNGVRVRTLEAVE